MGFKPLGWYCQPAKNQIWAKLVENAFGAYTPCAVETLVVGISHLVLFGVCFYRTWRIRRDLTVRRYCLRSHSYNYMLGLLAAYCTVEPLFKLVFGFSVSNLDGQTSFAPFEVSCFFYYMFCSYPFNYCSILFCLTPIIFIFTFTQ